jgi:hypothetical protein
MCPVIVILNKLPNEYRPEKAYQANLTLTNTGSAVREVQAALASVPQNVVVVNDILLFVMRSPRPNRASRTRHWRSR